MIDSPLGVIRSLVPNLNGKSILDVGCGDGRFATLLAAEGADVTGIDPNPGAIASAAWCIRHRRGGSAPV